MDTKVTAIMATCGRHELCERAVGMFLAQNYENKTLVILQNSAREVTLDRGLTADQRGQIRLINRSGYSNLGAIYEDSLNFVPFDTDVICFWDDDDIYLPNHISEGVAGYEFAQQLNDGIWAYKPMRSLFHDGSQISLQQNMFEPSWFVNADAIRKYKFNYTTGSQHNHWTTPLIDESRVLVINEAPSTFCYTWGNDVFKTSGDIDSADNFWNYRNASEDFGDDIITPWTKEQLEPAYTPINQFLQTITHLSNVPTNRR